MLKFFRKIRQKLINEEKVSKYLLYASGEIVLVVIGILIALSINNWNENRKNTQSENKALVDLKNEFANNMTELSRICTTRNYNDSLLRVYLAQVTSQQLDTDAKIELNTPGVFGAQWGTKTTVLSGIVNSGGLNNIKNDSLKVLLTNWPVLINRWEKRESFLQPAIINLRDYLASKTFRGIPEKGNNWVNIYPNHNRKKLLAQKRTFVNDIKFHNLLADLIGELWIQQFLCNKIEMEYNKIMEILEEEINSRNLK